MAANPPKLVENFKVEVIVENGVQSHLLLNEKVDILNYLRQNLQNYQIDLSPIIQTNTIIRKPITDIEKYQAMLVKNPLLDKLRQEFNLGFE
jgi:DNA polymerase-3 subunit gamma/tau